jgi:hypothetical protein
MPIELGTSTALASKASTFTDEKPGATVKSLDKMAKAFESGPQVKVLMQLSEKMDFTHDLEFEQLQSMEQQTSAINKLVSRFEDEAAESETREHTQQRISGALEDLRAKEDKVEPTPLLDKLSTIEESGFFSSLKNLFLSGMGLDILKGISVSGILKAVSTKVGSALGLKGGFTAAKFAASVAAKAAVIVGAVWGSFKGVMDAPKAFGDKFQDTFDQNLAAAFGGITSIFTLGLIDSKTATKKIHEGFPLRTGQRRR